MSARGTSLIELMVALLCSSLLAAGVLALVADAAWLCRQQRARAEAQSLAEVTAEVVTRALAEAGQGLEGATAVRWRGATVPVIEIGDESAAVPSAVLPAVLAAVVAATGPAVEVEPAAGGSGAGGTSTGTGTGATAAELSGRRRSYRAATVRPPGARRDRVLLAVDDRVVGLGLTDADGVPLTTVPAGTVREVSVDAGRGTVVIDWDEPLPLQVGGSAGGSAGASGGDTLRAVVPVRRRELGLRSFEGALQLRKRDDDGNWQPMIDSVGALTVEETAAAATSPARGAALVTARIGLPSGATGIARRRVALREAS